MYTLALRENKYSQFYTMTGGITVMIKMINSDNMESADVLTHEYYGCQYILIDINESIEDLQGKLYCLSTSADSDDELCSIADDLLEQGKKIAVLGVYRDIGLQCMAGDCNVQHK